MCIVSREGKGSIQNKNCWSNRELLLTLRAVYNQICLPLLIGADSSGAVV